MKVTSWLDLFKPDPSNNSFLDDVILHYFPGRQTLKTETESCTMKRAHIITKLGKASEVPEGTPSLSEQPGAWQMKVHDVLLQQALDSASLLRSRQDGTLELAAQQPREVSHCHEP